jgi:pteridine reductase
MQKFAAIHVQSPLLLCQKFEPVLRASHGHVINMIDLLAERPWPQYAAYSASKAALANLTLSLARELAPQVTVNGIAPGVVEWPKNYPQEEREKYLKRVPLARPGTPQDVANLVHFLATAGTYITGQIIRLDGGRSIT